MLMIYNINKSQNQMGPLLLGTFVWIVLAIAAGLWVRKTVSESSSLDKKDANLKVANLSIVLVAIQLWMMWITCYMHQQYPLISPKIQF